MQHSDTLLRKTGKDATLQSGISFSKKPKVWAKTKQKNLVRSVKTDRYYARVFAGGKEVWKSLKTSHYSVAQARLAAFLKEHRERMGNGNGSSAGISAKMTFGEAAAIHLRNLDDNPRIKPNTRDYWRRRLLAVVKSWPGLNGTEARRITPAQCKGWAGKYARKAAPITFNNATALLKNILSIAIEHGVIYANPAAVLRRVPLRPKEVKLPSIDKFAALLAEMRNGKSRYSPHCADFAEGMATTGCRVGEARGIAWRDIDFDAGELLVRGDATTGTKNWELRRVPLVPDARELFERMRSERSGEPLDQKVFRVRECQKSLNRACEKVGADRVTHHDLRHLFATRCIESGVDIPTVSRWLGHKDGGTLLMKTYGHLRREHSQVQAKRVTFSPGATKTADLIPFAVES